MTAGINSADQLLLKSCSDLQLCAHSYPLPPVTAPPCSGLLLSPGGEFAFVLFGEAVSRGIMGAALAKELYLVVALRWGHLAAQCLLLQPAGGCC